jgi:cell division protein FtsN
MKLIKDIYRFLVKEQKIPATLNSNRNRPGSIANAIKKRNPVSFFYNGPRGTVQPGKRYKAEMVAMGLSKKGNMIVRAWVEPPSRSKTGFEKGHWRTFMVARMNQIEIFDQETFDQKRPGYKEGDDNSMTVTYVTSDWSTTPQPEPQQPEPQQPEPQQQEPSQPEPQSVEPQAVNLPQPEPENRPSMEPPKADGDTEDEEGEDNNYDGLNESIKRIKELLYY